MRPFAIYPASFDGSTLAWWRFGERGGSRVDVVNGLKMTNYGTGGGADPQDDGYRFSRANLDYMQGALGTLPSLAAHTFECWLSGWAHADGETAYIGELYWNWQYRTLLYGRKHATPASSYLSYSWVENGTTREARWTNAAVASLLGGKDPIHLAGVVNQAAGTCRLFVNGVQRAENLNVALASPVGAGWVDLGWSMAKPASRSLSGVLDEVRVSSVARYLGGANDTEYFRPARYAEGRRAAARGPGLEVLAGVVA